MVAPARTAARLPLAPAPAALLAAAPPASGTLRGEAVHRAWRYPFERAAAQR